MNGVASHGSSRLGAFSSPEPTGLAAISSARTYAELAWGIIQYSRAMKAKLDRIRDIEGELDRSAS